MTLHQNFRTVTVHTTGIDPAYDPWARPNETDAELDEEMRCSECGNLQWEGYISERWSRYVSITILNNGRASRSEGDADFETVMDYPDYYSCMECGNEINSGPIFDLLNNA